MQRSLSPFFLALAVLLFVFQHAAPELQQGFVAEFGDFPPCFVEPGKTGAPVPAHFSTVQFGGATTASAWITQLASCAQSAGDESNSWPLTFAQIGDVIHLSTSLPLQADMTFRVCIKTNLNAVHESLQQCKVLSVPPKVELKVSGVAVKAAVVYVPPAAPSNLQSEGYDVPVSLSIGPGTTEAALQLAAMPIHAEFHGCDSLSVKRAIVEGSALLISQDGIPASKFSSERATPFSWHLCYTPAIRHPESIPDMEWKDAGVVVAVNIFAPSHLLYQNIPSSAPRVVVSSLLSDSLQAGSPLLSPLLTLFTLGSIVSGEKHVSVADDSSCAPSSWQAAPRPGPSIGIAHKLQPGSLFQVCAVQGSLALPTGLFATAAPCLSVPCAVPLPMQIQSVKVNGGGKLLDVLLLVPDREIDKASHVQFKIGSSVYSQSISSMPLLEETGVYQTTLVEGTDALQAETGLPTKLIFPKQRLLTISAKAVNSVGFGLSSSIDVFITGPPLAPTVMAIREVIGVRAIVQVQMPHADPPETEIECQLRITPKRTLTQYAPVHAGSSADEKAALLHFDLGAQVLLSAGLPKGAIPRLRARCRLQSVAGHGDWSSWLDSTAITDALSEIAGEAVSWASLERAGVWGEAGLLLSADLTDAVQMAGERTEQSVGIIPGAMYEVLAEDGSAAFSFETSVGN